MSFLNDNGIYIASVVATYWFMSISMVYLNKVLMSNNDVSISAPLFVTGFQCIVTTIICYMAGKCGERANSKNYSAFVQDMEGADAYPKKPSFFAQFPKAEYKLGTAKRVLPLSIIFVGMITFNNLALKWVEVSFYNVARSLTIVFNVFFSAVLMGIPTSRKTAACLAIVMMGFALGSHGEMNFSTRGTIAGVASSLFVSLNSIYTKKVLPAVEGNHWRLAFYNNVNACLLFLPLIIVFEGNVLCQQLLQKSGTFWTAMMVTGIFGFGIGILTVLQIKATSPLTHNISGTAKAAFQSMVAFRIWKNQATALGILGIFVTLGGSLLYTLVKMNENTNAKTTAAAQASNTHISSESKGGSRGYFAMEVNGSLDQQKLGGVRKID